MTDETSQPDPRQQGRISGRRHRPVSADSLLEMLRLQQRYAPGMTGQTTSTIMIAAPRNIVMSVIADFAAYPGWAGVHSAEVLGEPGADGRARRVRFGLDAGIIKDRFVLEYQWDGDEQARWEIVEPGSVISVMSGAYILTDQGEDTEVTFELTVGTRIPVIEVLRRRAEKIIIDTALKGLKSRVEAAARGDRGG